MVRSGGHDEMEIAVTIPTIAFGHHRFEGRAGLFERNSSASGIAIHLAKPQTQP